YCKLCFEHYFDDLILDLVEYSVESVFLGNLRPGGIQCGKGDHMCGIVTRPVLGNCFNIFIGSNLCIFTRGNGYSSRDLRIYAYIRRIYELLPSTELEHLRKSDSKLENYVTRAY